MAHCCRVEEWTKRPKLGRIANKHGMAPAAIPANTRLVMGLPVDQGLTLVPSYDFSGREKHNTTKKSRWLNAPRGEH
jgi:hypothetical protein